jgi:hypothetical protein
MWFWKLAALGFAGILDLAAGTLFIHLLSQYFAYPLSWWQYVIGAFLGASPDIDLLHAFFRKNASGHHEYLTHRPIMGISFAVTLAWLLAECFGPLRRGSECFGIISTTRKDSSGLREGASRGFGQFPKNIGVCEIIG